MTSTPFSRRTDWDLRPNPLSRKLETLKKEGRGFYDLTLSNPTRCGFVYPETLLKTFLDPENLCYAPESQGLSGAREVVAARYQALGYPVRPRDIFLTSSTSEAYTFLFRLLLNPGDTVLFPRPGYPLLSFLGELNDLTVRYYPLDEQRHWAINRDAEVFDDPTVRACVTVNPNNPTGQYLNDGDRAWLGEIAARRKWTLISDEVFFDYPLSGVKNQESLLCLDHRLGFVMGGLSKLLGLPQMKLSWIIVRGPDEIRAEAVRRLEVIADTYLSVNTPAQRALPAWLKSEDDISGQIRTRIRENFCRLFEAFQAHDSVDVLNSEGGWYAVLALRDNHDEEELVMELLEKENTLAHPGYFYDFPGGCHLVLSLLCPESLFEKGVEGIRRVLTRSS